MLKKAKHCFKMILVILNLEDIYHRQGNLYSRRQQECKEAQRSIYDE